MHASGNLYVEKPECVLAQSLHYKWYGLRTHFFLLFFLVQSDSQNTFMAIESIAIDVII